MQAASRGKLSIGCPEDAERVMARATGGVSFGVERDRLHDDTSVKVSKWKRKI